MTSSNYEPLFMPSKSIQQLTEVVFSISSFILFALEIIAYKDFCAHDYTIILDIGSCNLLNLVYGIFDERWRNRSIPTHL